MTYFFRKYIKSIGELWDNMERVEGREAEKNISRNND